jgi:hypothetical protein
MPTQKKNYATRKPPHARHKTQVKPLRGQQDSTSTLAGSLLYHYTIHIQIKNLSTTQFHALLRSTTFILEVSPFEVVEFQIREVQIKFFVGNMISNKKVVNNNVS